jgi:hypothetical protein
MRARHNIVWKQVGYIELSTIRLVQVPTGTVTRVSRYAALSSGLVPPSTIHSALACIPADAKMHVPLRIRACIHLHKLTSFPKFSSHRSLLISISYVSISPSFPALFSHLSEPTLDRHSLVVSLSPSVTVLPNFSYTVTSDRLQFIRRASSCTSNLLTPFACHPSAVLLLSPFFSSHLISLSQHSRLRSSVNLSSHLLSYTLIPISELSGGSEIVGHSPNIILLLQVHKRVPGLEISVSNEP